MSLCYFVCVSILFFFLIDPAPPVLYSFPYTTLFRSRFAGFARILSGGLSALPHGAVQALLVGTVVGVLLTLLEGTRHKKLDRKSTRLNSSHGSISYAVFCLKKKKKEDKTRRMKKVMR